MASIGIAVTTYNRIEALRHCLSRIATHTKSPYQLVVCDDGSTDGTREWLDDEGIPRIGQRNRGVAWNKNRGLYALLSRTSCDTIVVLEDDCYPDDDQWADFWIDVVGRHGHINLVHPATGAALDRGERPPEIVGGCGSAEHPFACTRISGLCIGSSRAALNEVGYLDSRFSGYGHEHAEWTTRFKKVGYGGAIGERDGEPIAANAMVSFGLRGLDIGSASDKSTVGANREVYKLAKGDTQRYRAPWRSPEEREALLSEVANSRLPLRHISLSLDVKPSQLDAESARQALVRGREGSGLRRISYSASEGDFLGLLRAVLERRPISALGPSDLARGFRETMPEDEGALDRNVDVALQSFVAARRASRPIAIEDVLDKAGRVRLLVSTSQTDSELIGFRGNVGDNYGLQVVRALSRRSVSPVGTWAPKDLPVMMTIGSFMQHARSRAVVWGTGCMAPMQIKPKMADAGSTFMGVRGPRTREELFIRYGELPPVTGDPGLLLPYTHGRYSASKTRLVGALLHSVDVEDFKARSRDIDWISNSGSLDEVVRFILSSECIITSSLHGVIFSHALGVPCMLVKLGDRLAGSEFKFVDYFQSVGEYGFRSRPDWSSLPDLNLSSLEALLKPQSFQLNGLQKALADTFPVELIRAIG